MRGGTPPVRSFDFPLSLLYSCSGWQLERLRTINAKSGRRDKRTMYRTGPAGCRRMPRRGPALAKYDEFMREREQKRLEAPPPKENADKTSKSR